MSALNIIVTPEAANLFTDGLAVLNGQVHLQACKVVALPHASAAYAGRGCMFLTSSVAGALNVRSTLDEMVARLPDAVASVEAHWRAQTGSDPVESEHLLAGWSDRLGTFAAFILATMPRDYGPPREIATITEGFMSPTVDLRPRPVMDIPRIGLDILRDQRAAYPEQVGGFAQHTIVRRDSVETRILERWPDRLDSLAA